MNCALGRIAISVERPAFTSVRESNARKCYFTETDGAENEKMLRGGVPIVNRDSGGRVYFI